jgi:hypothetical protein
MTDVVTPETLPARTLGPFARPERILAERADVAFTCPVLDETVAWASKDVFNPATSTDLRLWTKSGPAFAKTPYVRLPSKAGAIVTELKDGRLIAARIGGRFWMYWGEGVIYAATSDDAGRQRRPLAEPGALDQPVQPRRKPMSQHPSLALIGLLALAACSKPVANNGAASGSPQPAAVASAPAGNPCDRKLITTADMAPLFSEPITSAKALAGDPQSCVFETAGFSSGHVSLRPGLGHMSIDMILSGKTNQTVTPLSGVGDRAVWDATLKEVDAEKNGDLCEVGLIGPATSGATAEKVGAICSKIFAGG